MSLLRSQRGVKRPNEADAGSTGSRLVRAVLVAVAVAVAYVIVRRLRSDGSAPAIDEVTEAEPPEEPREITIDDPKSGADEGWDVVEEGGVTDATGQETAEVSGERLAEEERSSEELAERASEDVQEESPEPGEMTVDEEIVEDLVDESADEAESDEDAGAERGEADTDEETNDESET